ncbi:MAG: choice-of-anchor U domain-containing protein [bacterium]
MKTFRKGNRLIGLLPCLIIWVAILSPQKAQPEVSWQIGTEDYTIWQIGTKDDSCGEFTASEQRTIAYQVPKEWEEIAGQGLSEWDDFPPILFPAGDQELKTQEVSIQFDYPCSYSRTVLRIVASNSSRDSLNYLEVLKGDVLIGRVPVEIPLYTAFNFPLGAMEKGWSEGNRITVRNSPDQDNSSSPSSSILLDGLCLENYDYDNDWDGVCDADEGDGDWDRDGLPDSLDRDTVLLPLRSDNPFIIKKILIDIEESKNTALSFHEVGFPDANSLNLSGLPEGDRCFPYGLFGFTIEGAQPQEEVFIKISFLININFEDRLYPSLRFYLFQGSSGWDETAWQSSDSNSYIADLILMDGAAGDWDEEEDGSIHTYLAPSYPISLNAEVDRGNCFIGALK